jgi:hypothetical protein
VHQHGRYQARVNSGKACALQVAPATMSRGKAKKENR